MHIQRCKTFLIFSTIWLCWSACWIVFYGEYDVENHLQTGQQDSTSNEWGKGRPSIFHHIDTLKKYNVDTLNTHAVDTLKKHPVDTLTNHPVDTLKKHSVDTLKKHHVDTLKKHHVKLVVGNRTNWGTNEKVAKGLNITEESQMEVDKYMEYFKQWPKDKAKAAFYVLTHRISQLEKMLQSLDVNFNNRFHYPVIIFHEAGLESYIRGVKSITNSTLFFQLVTFRIPEFIHTPFYTNPSCNVGNISYRHMCRFNAKSVYDHPTLRVLDYYWRLDDDSRLLGPPITYDVFAFMSRENLHYGFIQVSMDYCACVAGLWKATENYIKQNNLHPKFFNEWMEPMMYFNNFEISSTVMWFSQQYKDYINYLDKLGGIYYTRWGDAPIHSLAVSLFLDENATHQFHDIGYQHGEHHPEHHPYVHRADTTRNQRDTFTLFAWLRRKTGKTMLCAN